MVPSLDELSNFYTSRTPGGMWEPPLFQSFKCPRTADRVARLIECVSFDFDHGHVTKINACHLKRYQPLLFLSRSIVVDRISPLLSRFWGGRQKILDHPLHMGGYFDRA